MTQTVRDGPYFDRPAVLGRWLTRLSHGYAPIHEAIAGNEPMHFAVQPDLPDPHRPKDLERTAVVVQADSRDERDQAVRNPGWNTPREPWIFPMDSPAAYDVVAFL